MAGSGVIENPTGDKTLFIKTYGCQMNVYDSNRIKDLFSNKGYKITKDISKADLTVLNTCHILSLIHI